MSPHAPPMPLAELYEADETAWLDKMARLAADGRRADLDLDNLSEFLTSMAASDRRQVVSRLMVLLTHLLKRDFQPDKQTSSWRATILHQQHELQLLLGSGTLRRYAEEVVPSAYVKAVRQAAAETDLPENTFPAECPYTFDQILGVE